MNKNAEKQAAFRARKKERGEEEVRGIFLPKELHKALKHYAKKMSKPA
jgi:hypothetical protein